MAENREGGARTRPQVSPETMHRYLAVRLQVLLVSLALLALLGVLILAANSVFDLSKKSSVLILVIGIYVVFPVGFVVLAVRKYLNSQAADSRGQDG